MGLSKSSTEGSSSDMTQSSGCAEEREDERRAKVSQKGQFEV